MKNMQVIVTRFSGKGNTVLLIGRSLTFFVAESSAAVLSCPNPLNSKLTKH